MTTLEAPTRSPGQPVDMEPLAVEGRYEPPRADIDADREKTWFRRLWPVVGSHRTILIAGVVLGVFSLVTQVAVPAAAREAIDAVAAENTSDLTTWVWVLVALGLSRLVFGTGYRYLLFKLAYLVDADLRALVYTQLTRLSFSYFDRTQSGQVISSANSDIRSIQLLLAFGPLALMSMLIFTLALLFMFSISVSLTLVTIVTLPGVYVLGNRFRRKVFPLSWLTQARMAEVATIVDENVNGIRVVKSFAAEPQQIRTLSKAAKRLQWSSTSTVLTRARYNPLIEALPRLSMALVLLYGGWLAIDSQVSIGTLFAFSAYVLMLQMPFRMIGFLLLQTQRAGASADRIYKILDEEPEVAERPGAADLAVEDGLVEFRNVSFRYPESTGAASRPAVLDGFDLRIEPGERLALVGRTGSGKSTVARLLARFYDVGSGAVCIDGVDVADVTLASLRHNVGIVMDEPFLFSTSLADNIAFGQPAASREAIIAAATAANAHGFVSALSDGYDTVIGERGYTLSGGQRQRIAIARTLLMNPAVLVLDDATSAIDVKVEAEIHAALLNLMDNRTTVIIAHRLSTISLANRVALIEAGRVAATGTHEELLANEPRYAEILTDSNGAGA
jgi:ATP-binding cassette subfamily B protein